MTAPSLIHAVQQAPDRARRIRLMAETMVRHASGPEESCSEQHLRAAGFTQAEIAAYGDDARALISGRRNVRLAPSPQRVEGEELVRQARATRKRLAAQEASAAQEARP